MAESAESFWRAHAAQEKATKSMPRRCQQCTALLKHPRLSCEQVAARLRYAAREYDREHPWNWPPIDLYSTPFGEWRGDKR